MAVPRFEGQSDAEAAVMAIWATVGVAMDVAAGRALDPNSYPLVPLGRDAAASHFIRKTLGDLLELGYCPEGWEKAFMGPLPGDPSWGGS
ncbi:hypothetical protein GCM10009718_33060 [Isoptericola halotolerans]|uniref:Uncharacterized protein n=1 Tax=Isoptericola halotolerans TaxID=300560 RepID=A0ABX2A5Y2_9MICO|nr:hypothetical protein [Isoptericola halotolerans]NOV98194.1 hypothetical protein [Isoptericola halotolerans]